MLSFVLTTVWVGVAGAALISGMEYYLLPLEERAYSELAPLFAPTGLVGHGLGIVGTLLLLVGVIGYSARKRLPFLSRSGALKHWLQVHIFLCTLGPFLVLLHTTFKFGGLVSIAFWSMALVVLSGVFGRYVYVRIPKTIQGRFLDVAAVSEQIVELTRRMATQADIPLHELEAVLVPAGAAPRAPGLGSALGLALREDLRQRRVLRELRAFLRDRGVPQGLQGSLLEAAAGQRRLRQQALLLHPFQRLFRY